MKLDFVTIACRRDIDLFHLQARSFNKFVDPDSVNQILVVINDNDSTLINDLNICEFGIHTDRVVLKTYEDIVSVDLSRNKDWFSQQVVKLYAYSQVRTQWYVTLDTKNIFVKPINTSTFVIDNKANNQGLMGPLYAKHDYHHWYIACEYMGIDALNNDPPSPATPFVLNTQQVSDLIAYCDQRNCIPFYDWFYQSHDKLKDPNSVKSIWEYMIYSAWLYKNNLYLDLYNLSPLMINQGLSESEMLSGEILILHPQRLIKNLILEDSVNTAKLKKLLVTECCLLTNSEFEQFISKFE